MEMAKIALKIYPEVEVEEGGGGGLGPKF